MSLMPAPAADLVETEVNKLLKAYRLQKSREENVKPYYIYNNAQLEALILAMPKTIDEMMQVSGFGEAKCAKYGEDIFWGVAGFR